MTVIKNKLLSSKRLSIILLTLLLSALSLHVYASGSNLPTSSIKTKAITYIEGLRVETLRSFLVLSAVKMGLSIIEGSTIDSPSLPVGPIRFGGSLQLGDAVQSVLDAIDLVWRFMFFSFALLSLFKLILNFSGTIGYLFMSITFILFLFTLILKWLENQGSRTYNYLIKLTLLCGLFSVICLLLFPGIFMVSDQLTTSIVSSDKEESIAHLEQIRDDIYVSRDDNIFTRLGLSTEYAHELSGILRSTIISLTDLTVAYLMEIIIIPLFAFIVLFYIMKFSALYIIGDDKFSAILKKLGSLTNVLK